MDESEVKSRIRKIIHQELAVLTENLADNDPFDKLKVDTDDWSFLFIPRVETEFGIKVPINDWETVWTISEVAKLVQKHL